MTVLKNFLLDNTHFTWNLRINNVVDGDQGYYQCYIQENPDVSVTHYVIVEGKLNQCHIVIVYN